MTPRCVPLCHHTAPANSPSRRRFLLTVSSSLLLSDPPAQVRSGSSNRSSRRSYLGAPLTAGCFEGDAPSSDSAKFDLIFDRQGRSSSPPRRTGRARSTYGVPSLATRASRGSRFRASVWRAAGRANKALGHRHHALATRSRSRHVRSTTRSATRSWHGRSAARSATRSPRTGSVELLLSPSSRPGRIAAALLRLA